MGRIHYQKCGGEGKENEKKGKGMSPWDPTKGTISHSLFHSFMHPQEDEEEGEVVVIVVIAVVVV